MLRPSVVLFALGAVSCAAKAPPVSPVSPAVEGNAKPVANADEVVERLRPHFRDCYKRGLAADPNMEGRVVFDVEVLADGKVGKVGLPSREGTLSDEVVACMSLLIRPAVFSPPRTKHPEWVAVPISLLQNETKLPPRARRRGIDLRSKESFMSSCVTSPGDPSLTKRCECTWSVFVKRFTPSELQDDQLLRDPRLQGALVEANTTCATGDH